MQQIIWVEKISQLLLEQLKQILRIEHSLDDQILLEKLSAALEFAENFTSLGLLQRKVKFSAKIADGKITPPFLPIISIEKAILNQEDVYDQCSITERAILLNKNGNCQIIYNCGFKHQAMPPSIKEGVLLHAALSYENPSQPNKHLHDVISFYKFFRQINI